MPTTPLGYWTEGTVKNINGTPTNVGGGTFVAGTPPAQTASATTPPANAAASNMPSKDFTSSAQPMVTKQTTQGMTNAYNGLTGNSQNAQQGNQSGTIGGVDINAFLSQQAQNIQTAGQAAQGAASTAYNTGLANANLGLQQAQLQYNTGLGQINTAYQADWQNLQVQHMNSASAALALSAQASGGQSMSGAGAAQQYVGKLNDLYQISATQLTNAYMQQQTALSNQNTQAALKIQEQINNITSQYSQQTAQILQSITQSYSQLGTTALGIGEFLKGQQTTATSQFITAVGATDLSGVKTDSTSAQLSSIYPDLYKTGLSSGLTEEQITAQLKSGSISQARLGISAAQLGISQANLAMKQAEFYQTQNVSALIQGLGARPTTNTAGEQNTYDQSLLNISGKFAGDAGKPSADVQPKITAIESSIGALDILSGAITNNESMSGVGGTIAQRFPMFSIKASSFDGAVKTLAGTIDKSLGLNTTDQISKMLSSANTPEARQNIIDTLKSAVANVGVSTLTSNAHFSNMSSYSGLLTQLQGMKKEPVSTGGSQFGITKPQ